jgi:Flp pilus assembly CpaE family ATPase
MEDTDTNQLNSCLSDHICVVKHTALYVCEIENFDAVRSYLENYDKDDDDKWFTCNGTDNSLIQVTGIIVSAGANHKLETPLLKLNPDNCPLQNGNCFVVPVVKKVTWNKDDTTAWNHALSQSETWLSAVNDLNGKKKPEDHLSGERGRIYAFFGPKGGMGVTFMAVNMAAHLNALSGGRLLLLDLNLQLGNVYPLLDMEGRLSLYDWIYRSQTSEIPPFETIDRHASGIYVLGNPRFELQRRVTPEEVESLLSICRSYFRFVVIDLPSGFDGNNLAVIDNADLIYLILEANIPSVYATRHTMDLFKQLGIPDGRIKVVLNRYQSSDEITPKDIEKALETKIYHRIPNDYKAVITSMNEGIPLVSSAKFHPVSRR